RSHWTAVPPTSVASGSRTSARRPVSANVAPRAANARAIASAIPSLAPVIKTFPLRRLTAGGSLAALGREHGECRGEPVQEAPAADRPDLDRGDATRRRASRRL